ncbi:MAG: hypothetical protein M0Z45_01725 [Actinomycetota bacterium]|nr:hypothetical protein [Actinomycetota bacterium]
MRKVKGYSPEDRDRVVHMVTDHRGEYRSTLSAFQSPSQIVDCDTGDPPAAGIATLRSIPVVSIASLSTKANAIASLTLKL